MAFNKKYFTSILLVATINLLVGLNAANADIKSWLKDLGKKEDKAETSVSSIQQSSDPAITYGTEVTVKDSKGKVYTYREAKVPESERVALPAALQSQIDKSTLDNIELSTLLAKGVKAKRGFTININKTNTLGKSDVLIDCDALESGLLSCVSKTSNEFNKESTIASLPKAHTTRSLSAYGGILMIGYQNSSSDRGTSGLKHIPEIMPNIIPTPKPHELDLTYTNVVYKNDGTVGSEDFISKYKLLKCREPKAENTGNIPEVGDYKLLFCISMNHGADDARLDEYTKDHRKRFGQNYKDNIDRVLVTEYPDESKLFTRDGGISKVTLYSNFQPMYYFHEHGLILPTLLFDVSYLPSKYRSITFQGVLYSGPIFIAQPYGSDAQQVQFKLK